MTKENQTLAILAGLTVAGLGIYYLSTRNRSELEARERRLRVKLATQRANAVAQAQAGAKEGNALSKVAQLAPLALAVI